MESNFLSKVFAATGKKQDLYQSSKGRYAVRAMFAGAFLTLSTAAGAIGADVINKIAPGSGRFIFPAFFVWGLAYIVFLNAELVTSNMMFLTAGTYSKKIKWNKALEILLYCTFFNLLGALITGWAFAHSAAFSNLTTDSFIVKVVENKLARSNELILLEGILANVFVNIAILSFILVKDGTAKLLLVLSAIYMFVFLTNEHIAANFASFAIVKFGVVGDQVKNGDWINILRHWSVTWIANFIGGGLIIGLPYAWLNKDQETYVD